MIENRHLSHTGGVFFLSTGFGRGSPVILEQEKFFACDLHRVSRSRCKDKAVHASSESNPNQKLPVRAGGRPERE